jgi:hypothetical protein
LPHPGQKRFDGVAALFASSPSTAVPQEGQNFMARVTGSPHLVQGKGSGAAHCMHAVARSGLSAPHLGQGR